MNCCNNLIGLRNLCSEDGKTLHYLDDVGISLKTIAQGVDDRHVNAKALFERCVHLAWEDVFNDLSINGSAIDGVLYDGVSGYVSETIENVTNHSETFEIQRRCKLAKANIGCFVLEGTGTATITYTVDGVEVKEWENFEFEGKHYFEVQSEGLNHEISIVGDVDLYKADNVANLYANNGLTYSTLEYYIQCDPKVYLCKYSKLLSKAALYKCAAIIWKQIKEGSRWNEFIEIKKEDAVEQMAWLDSTYNLLRYDPAVNDQYKPKGMYQLELEKIKIPEPKNCPCCMKCKGDRIVISLP